MQLIDYLELAVLVALTEFTGRIHIDSSLLNCLMKEEVSILAIGLHVHWSTCRLDS
jgi:hypothetical protein